ncbi:hypothetical protein [Mycobacterium szulgai]|uniref:hypothetical protein n=1 Tax=Mycobacterium szulgai TaxID=1787 RepID=UPI0035589076
MATPLTLHTESDADGTPRLIATGEIDLSNIARFTRRSPRPAPAPPRRSPSI